VRVERRSYHRYARTKINKLYCYMPVTLTATNAVLNWLIAVLISVCVGVYLTAYIQADWAAGTETTD